MQDLNQAASKEMISILEHKLVLMEAKLRKQHEETASEKVRLDERITRMTEDAAGFNQKLSQKNLEIDQLKQAAAVAKAEKEQSILTANGLSQQILGL
mmetsp:Transcript_4543/g.6862  ORF Transcript_4543/g.6862 Transcript_4543/m.6862 type:complete len:98 (+) Transcript_4543:455-748(+)